MGLHVHRVANSDIPYALITSKDADEICKCFSNLFLVQGPESIMHSDRALFIVKLRSWKRKFSGTDTALACERCMELLRSNAELMYSIPSSLRMDWHSQNRM